MLNFLTEVIWVIEIEFSDFPDHILAIVTVREGCKPSSKLIGEHSQTPEIQPEVIIFLEGNFWAYVIRSTTIGPSPLGWISHMNRPPKISHLDFIINGQENIFRFDIPMNDLMGMSVLKSLDHLVNVMRGTRLWELLLVLENLVELAVGRVVQDDVDAFVVEKEPVHGQDVWVFEVAVDLYLAAKLEHDVVVDDLLLGDHLDCDNSFGFTMSGKIHMSVLAFAQMPADLEIVYAPVAWVEDLALGMDVQVFWRVVQHLWRVSELVQSLYLN